MLNDFFPSTLPIIARDPNWVPNLLKVQLIFLEIGEDCYQWPGATPEVLSIFSFKTPGIPRREASATPYRGDWAPPQLTPTFAMVFLTTGC